MKIIITALSFLLILLISSCQREADAGRINGTNGADSTVLSKFVVLDTVLPSGMDTLDLFFLEYNNQKRIQRIVNYSRTDTATTAAYPLKTEIFYYYTGNDTLPFKTTSTLDELNYHQKDTSYHFYQNGLVSYDSTRYSDTINGDPYRGISIRSYTVAGTNVLVRERYYDLADPIPYICQSDYTYTDISSNGNITSENASSTGCVTGSWGKQASYDNKINPFYSTDLHYPVLVGTLAYWGELSAGKNNNIEELFADLSEHLRYHYTYRNDGYPLTVRTDDLVNNSGASSKGLYFYKN